MANAAANTDSTKIDADRTRSPKLTAAAVAWTIARGLASLRLTVALFALSIILVFVGTLAQAELGMWRVLDDYFGAWLAVIPIKVFFPTAWFPPDQYPGLHRIPSSMAIPFPGGALIGAVMVVNLLAAHCIRFKVQGKGTGLVTGLLLTLAGLVLTTLIILGGHNSEGLQATPPFSWQALWLMVKAAMVVLSALAAALTVWLTVESSKGETHRWLLYLVGGAALNLAGLTAWIWIAGEKAYIGDPAMRILWQLTQAGVAGLIVLAGSVFVFRKRAGIVVIHAGVLLLMFGQFWVSMFDTEEQMVIGEGSTVNFGRDIRAVELAVTGPAAAPTEQQVTVVPLIEKGSQTKYVKRPDIIKHAELPFDLRVDQFYENSDVEALKPTETSDATEGFGTRFIARNMKPVSGADSSGEVNQASAYITLLEKGSAKKYGTYLVSQLFAARDMNEKVSIEGVPYELSLRFKRKYKDYSMHLIDVIREDYLGTSTPRDYRSIVRISDPTKNVDREVPIWMNNPLRYGGSTFYQSGYRAGPVETTTLQVVKNSGWMIPYVACMYVGIGLCCHFLQSLVRFLNRQQRSVSPYVPDEAARVARVVEAAGKQSKAQTQAGTAARAEATDNSSEPAQPSSVFGRLVFPSLILVVMGGWLLSKARPAKDADGQMQIHAFGALPVAYEGRVKPFDTVARSSLRIISDRETFEPEYRPKQRQKKEPAIRWLLDVMSHSEQAKERPVFRIDNFEVQHLLGLPRRKGMRYSFAEFEPRMDEFRRQVQLAQEASETNPDTMSAFQRKVIELERKIQLFLKLSESHRLPTPDDDDFDTLGYVMAASQLVRQIEDAPVPYAVPTGRKEKAWEPLAVAATRDWLRKLASENQYADANQMAGALVESQMTDDYLEELAKLRVLQLIEGIRRQQSDDLPRSELRQYALDMYDRMEDDMRDGLLARQVSQIPGELKMNVANAIATAMGKETLEGQGSESQQQLSAMLAAYRAGDVDKFNSELATYRSVLGEQQPEGYQSAKLKFEAYFNHFAPFFYTAWLYMVAFVLSAFAWLGWNKPLNRSAFWLLLFLFAVHTVAILGRIYISGRPPVTNLYSSALFIGWGCVGLALIKEAIFRRGYGNVVAAVSGFGTLLVAYLLNTEVFSHKGDTFTVMQAVLDTQIWLATHVVCISLGYSTTFLAGIMGLAYVFRGVFTPSLDERERADLGRMIYGTLCFAIFFSFIGTVLGGLWADDSWGRFWGWDPKENGALIIVLWNCLVLHARWGGLVKQRGVAVLAVVGNIVTCWSWFGVNELGVGLHSYGFTEGVLPCLFWFVVSQLAMIGIGCVPTSIWMSYRRPTGTTVSR